MKTLILSKQQMVHSSVQMVIYDTEQNLHTSPIPSRKRRINSAMYPPALARGGVNSVRAAVQQTPKHMRILPPIF